LNKAIKSVALATIAAGGFALAALVGVALARTFTLNVAKDAKVTNQQGVTTHEAIAVGLKKRAVYILAGDSKSHPKCTAANHCFTFWPPVTVAAGKKATKAAGIKGKLSLWHRNGFFQVLLNGHPLYYYAGDTKGADATGQGIFTFGGTWSVVKTGGSRAGSTSTASSTTTTSTTPTYTYTTPTTTTTTPTTPTTTTPCTTPYCY
jgi:predicted lipoprotein with Yx(FWY)xxD motif